MLREILQGALDLVYPKVCVLCKKKLTDGAIEKRVCASCWMSIKKNVPPFCYSCGRNLSRANIHKNLCPGCLRHTLHFDRAFSPCVYEGTLKELIHKFKYEGKDFLGAPLSLLMIDFIKEYNLPIEEMDYLIPVPLHRARLREREFNQSEILARHIGKVFNTPVRCEILTRTRNTKRQTDLESEERTRNVQKSFAVNHPSEIKDKNLFLIDDILTTAATASESSRALKEAGARIIFVLTLAH